MSKYKTESKGTYLQLPKELLFDEKYQNLSISAITLYSILRDRHSLSLKNNWKDENGNTYIIFQLKI